MQGTKPAAQEGFAIIDLLIALMIVSILAGVGFSSYRNLASRAHQASARTAMIDTLMRASTHAAAAQARVVVCPSTRLDACDAPGSDWSQGWISFIDSNADRQRNPGERIVGSKAMPGHVRIISTAGRPVIAFTRRGDTAGSNITFTFCDATRKGHASGIAMGNSAFWKTIVPTAGAAMRCTHPQAQ